MERRHVCRGVPSPTFVALTRERTSHSRPKEVNTAARGRGRHAFIQGTKFTTSVVRSERLPAKPLKGPRHAKILPGERKKRRVARNGVAGGQREKSSAVPVCARHARLLSRVPSAVILLGRRRAMLSFAETNTGERVASACLLLALMERLRRRTEEGYGREQALLEGGGKRTAFVIGVVGVCAHATIHRHSNKALG